MKFLAFQGILGILYNDKLLLGGHKNKGISRKNWQNKGFVKDGTTIKGTPSIPETYLSSSVAWGLNLRVG